MEACIHSLLPGGNDVEILIVDDGSTKDKTAKIADWYEKKHPGIVRAIHQENAGHGGAVNTGLAHATGLYFKVVDSDDRVSLKAYQEILKVLRQMANSDVPADMVISNFIYDKQGAKRKKIMQYRKFLPQNRIFTWSEVRNFKLGTYILMHSVIYRTQVLKDCGLELPKHTFYVDNIFVFQPFPYVKTMYYADVNFYKYFIGREDQSVNEEVMISRIDQQLRVNYIMIDEYTKVDVQDTKLKRYMLNYLTIITAISSILAIRSKNSENLEKKRKLWEYLKETNPGAYRKIRYGVLGIGLNLPGKTGRKLASYGYKIAQKIYGFN